MTHNNVVNKTPNDAKWTSARYFCAYRAIVGAEGIPETITAINSKECGTDKSIKGIKNKGMI